MQKVVESMKKVAGDMDLDKLEEFESAAIEWAAFALRVHKGETLDHALGISKAIMLYVDDVRGPSHAD